MARTTMAMTTVITLIMMITMAQAFNLDTSRSSVLTGPPESDFGFSVALWSDMDGKPSLVVGAPKGKNSTLGQGTLPLGNIFFCDAQGNECLVDPRLPTVSEEDKSQGALVPGLTSQQVSMAFGHTLSTIKTEHSKLAVCAPHYPRYEDESVQLRGACYLLNNTVAEPEKFVPYMRQTSVRDTVQYIMAGFSAELFIKNNYQLVTGGPSGFAGRGVVNVKNFRIAGVGRVNRFSLSQSEEHLDTTYEGWQVVVGKFDGRRFSIAASAVNYGSFTGQVKFYPVNISPNSSILSIEGTEIGAKFGYSLATGDFDNDGSTDLVIGAPLSQGNNFIPDAGSFHVLYAPLKRNTQQNVVRGRKPWGRFGLALSSVGDINKDGFPDLAVGAPYEEGGGAVYIYNGGPQGLLQQPSQVLRSSDFGGGLLGLGFSVDGGIDMDNNGYPDMAIGALNSNQAVLVRSAPVLTLVGEVKFESDSVLVEDKACYIDSAGYKKVKGICFQLKVNLQYRSERPLGKLKMEFRMRLEGQADPPHNVFQTTNDYRYSRNMTVGFVGRPTPWSVAVFSKANRSAIGQRLMASVSVHLLPEESGSEDSVPPILDALSPTNFSTAVVLTCNDSSTCFSKPDMSLEGSAQPLTVGSERASVNVQLRVKNDSAYSVEVKVQHPAPLMYHSVESQGQHPDCRYHSLVGVANPTEFLCQFGFIATDELVNFTLFFNHDPESLMRYLDESPLIVKMSVSSDSVDTNMDDNHVDIAIPTLFDAVLNTQQNSQPDIISLKVNQSASMSEVNAMLAGNSNFSVQRLGPEMIHEFLVNNRGPTPVANIKLEVSIPLFSNGGQMVNYLYAPPVTYGPIKCSQLETNTLSLRRDVRHVTASPGNPRRKRKAEQFTSHYSSSPEYLYDNYYSDYYYYSDYHFYHYDSNALLTERRTMREEENGKDSEDFFINSEKESLSNTYQKVITCTSSKCRIMCDIDILPADEFVKVAIPSFLVVAGLDKLGYRSVSLKTVLRMIVEQENSTVINPTSIATTTVTLIKSDDVGFNNVPIWIWLLAVLISLILILIMMAILWRVGFFKRNRPPTGAKRESLIHQEYSVCKPDPDSDVMKSVNETP